MKKVLSIPKATQIELDSPAVSTLNLVH